MAQGGIRITSDVKGAREFNTVMEDYVRFTKRSVPEIINAKLYFVALRAMGLTKRTTKESILEKLREPSKKYPDVPLENILVNWKLTQQGKKGIAGTAMEKAVEKLRRLAVRFTQFLRSGWNPAVKDLDYWNKKGDINFVKTGLNGLKKPQGIKQFGNRKGSVIAALTTSPRPVMFGSITNSAGQEGKQHNQYSQASELIEDGLSKAVQTESQSMRDYITRKLQQKIDRVNKTNTTR